MWSANLECVQREFLEEDPVWVKRGTANIVSNTPGRISAGEVDWKQRMYSLNRGGDTEKAKKLRAKAGGQGRKQTGGGEKTRQRKAMHAPLSRSDGKVKSQRPRTEKKKKNRRGGFTRRVERAMYLGARVEPQGRLARE